MPIPINLSVSDLTSNKIKVRANTVFMYSSPEGLVMVTLIFFALTTINSGISMRVFSPGWSSWMIMAVEPVVGEVKPDGDPLRASVASDP